jgi:hypothetical protein
MPERRSNNPGAFTGEGYVFMDEAACIREFEKLAERLGIEVRTVSGAPPGLCAVKGKRVLFLDAALDRGSIIAVFAREFRGLDLENVSVLPAIRRFLEDA